MKPSVIATAALLAGCEGVGPDAQVHSVQYYQEHLAEARQAYRPEVCGGENYFPTPQTNRRQNCQNAGVALFVRPATVVTQMAPTVVLHATTVSGSARPADSPH